MKKLFGLLAVVLLVASGARAAVQMQLVIDKHVDISATPLVASVTVYAASDALGNRMTWAGVTRRAGGVAVVREMLVVSTQSTTVGFTLMLMSRTFTASLTNEAFAPVAGEVRESFVGKIVVAGTDWTALGTGTSFVRKTDVDLVVNLPAGQDDLHGQLMMGFWENSFAADNFVVTLKIGWL